MSDPKSRKTAARKTTRARGGAKAGLEGQNAAGAPDDGSTASAQSNELRNTEEPVLGIEQVSGADMSADNRSDNSYPSDGADGLDAEIRRRAYELYLARGGAEGNDLQDWLEAERTIRSGRRGSDQSAQDAARIE